MYIPLCFDIGAGSDVVLAGQHKLVVQNPLWLVVEARARVELYNLSRDGDSTTELSAGNSSYMYMF